MYQVRAGLTKTRFSPNRTQTKNKHRIYCKNVKPLLNHFSDPLFVKLLGYVMSAGIPISKDRGRWRRSKSTQGHALAPLERGVSCAKPLRNAPTSLAIIHLASKRLCSRIMVMTWVSSIVAVVAMVMMTTCEGISTCDKISACSCRSEDGVIDLSSLDVQGTPR